MKKFVFNESFFNILKTWFLLKDIKPKGYGRKLQDTVKYEHRIRFKLAQKSILDNYMPHCLEKIIHLSHWIFIQ